MSIFGSRNKTTVGTSVSRVLDDQMLPNSIKSGAIAAIMQNSNQSVEYAMDELVSGLATRMNRMNRYGRNGYIHGAPEANTYSAFTGKDIVEQALEADVGLVDSIDYYHLSPMNLLHVGWMKLVSLFDYDSSTNMMVVNGKQVYLSNMQAVVTESNFAELENGSMDRWGPLPTAGVTPIKQINLTGMLATPPAFLIDAAAPADYIRVEYSWEEETLTPPATVPVKVVKTETLDLTITGYSLSANYFQVRYLKDGKAGYWMYQLDSGLKPEVDAIFDAAPTYAGTYFPWAYFRFDKQRGNANKSSPEYLSGKKLLNIINMDYDEVCDAIHDSPDIGDVEQAMMMAAVPAKTTSEIEQRYLFDFFTKQYISSQAFGKAPSSPRMAVLEKLFNTNPPGMVTIKIQDKRFKMALSFERLVRHRVAGKADKDNPNNKAVYHSGTNINTITGKIETIDGQPADWPTNVATHYYRKQITENLYEEILVSKLKMVYWIWGDYTETADENESTLLIPLDYSIIEDYSLIDREALYGRSLHYIFNSRVVTKLKWYQTGIFRALMIVVAIVIMFYNIAAGLKVLAAQASLQAAAYLVLMAAIKYVLVTVAVRLFVRLVGVRMAFIAAVIAAVLGMYQIYQAGSVAGAPWASELVNTANGLTKAITREVGKEMDALRAEAEEFEKYKETQTKLLDDALELLNGGNHLTPMIIWGETPDDFYQRTVHSGNIGMVGIEAVSSFVQMKLTLPKLTETLGDYV